MLRRFHPGWLRKRAWLPTAFRPFECEQLIRVGRGADGGYVIDIKSLREAKFLLSGGIDIDWSFEADFLQRNPVPLVAFDASVGIEAFEKKANEPRGLFKSRVDYQKISYEYSKFFIGPRKHVAQFIGRNNAAGQVDIEQIALEYLPVKQLSFVKLDIEGSEYDVLDQLLEIAPQLSGLVMELHDLPFHIHQVLQFIEKIPLKICHLHINNWQPLNLQCIPKVIELSFSRYCSDVPIRNSLPNVLDRACCNSAPDFQLNF